VVSTVSVSTLEYQLKSRNRYDTFDQARPWRGALGGWDCLLADMRLEARSTDSFAEVAKARATLEPLLRAWEAKALLDGQYELEFRFERGRTRDGSEEKARSGTSADSAEDRIYRRANEEYPAPDPSFVRTPLVEQLLTEINDFRHAETTLPAAAAAVIDLLRTLAGGSAELAAVAASINTDAAVIEKVAELAARGQPVPGPDDPPPFYRGPEWQWLQEALLRLTLQTGRAADGPPQSRLTLADFHTQL
jgi:hypothetical protein